MVLVLGSNERAKAPEEVPFRCFDGHRLTIGRPSTIYQTVSLGTWVNKIVPGRSKTARNVSGGRSTGPRPLTCCRRGRYVAVEAEEIVRVVAVLELHQTLEVLR